MSRRAITFGLVLAAAGIASTARATTAASPDANERSPQSTTVRYHENALVTIRGAQRLYASIDRAAHDVCDDTGEFVLRQSFAGCELSAIADAVAEVDNAQLTAVYNEHFPGSPLVQATSLRLIPAIIVIVG
jgi:UrcA family protein